MKKIFLNIGIATLALVLLGSCASRQALVPAKVPTSSQEAPSSQAPAVQDWEQQWQDLVKAAKKEGRVVIYSSTPAMRELTARFYEKYGIQMELTSGPGGPLTQKVATERRAGLYLPDVFLHGPSTLIGEFKPAGYIDPIGPSILLPEIKDPAVWLGGRGPRFLDADRMIVSVTANPNHPLGINTNQVKPGDIRSYKDLLSPGWKGKILMNDPTIAGIAGTWFGMMITYIMDLDYMRQLARQEPVISQNMHLQVEWLAQSKYPVVIAPSIPEMYNFRQAGAPVAGFTPDEGTELSPGTGSFVLMNRAPHPNAAKIFLNWFLTKEAGILWQKATGAQNARLDVPSDSLDPEGVRKAGARYYMGDEKFFLGSSENRKLAREIFGHLLR